MAKRVIAVIHSNVGSALSRQALKVLSRQVNAATALPESRCLLKWVNTPLTFGPGDLPQNMAGAGELPLMVSPTIAMRASSTYSSTVVQASMSSRYGPSLRWGSRPGS